MPSGEGGHIRIPGTPTVNVFVEEWVLDKNIETPDVTDSGSQGYRQREATLRDGTGTAGIIWRPTSNAEDMGLAEGDEAVVNLLLGSSGLAYILRILVNSVSTTNTAKGDVIRQRISFQHSSGGITGPITAQAAIQQTEDMVQQIMAQEEENARAISERTGNGGRVRRQHQWRGVSRESAKRSDVRQSAEVGT